MATASEMDVKQHKANKSKQSCCVPDCNKPGYLLENGEIVTFHVLPKDEQVLKDWLLKIHRDIGRQFSITRHTKICSRHFQRSDFRITYSGKKFLKPNAVPSIFAKCGSASLSVPTGSTDATLNENLGDSQHLLLEKVLFLERKMAAGQKVKGKTYRKERDIMLQSTQNQVETTKNKFRFSVEQFEDNNADICFYTGFPSFSVMKECFRLLNPVDNIVYYDTKGKKLAMKNMILSDMNQFFLTLVRLRLGLMVKDLAQRFNISVTSVNMYFTSWVNFMYLRFDSLDIWPSKAHITKTMPEAMNEKYPNLEWIIDAFEIQTQRPTLRLQSQSYCNDKTYNIVKGLVACTPSGQVGFVSQLYTGNISDRKLTVRSGFLDMPHTRGSMWLVGDGFQIADLAQPLGVHVNMPHIGCERILHERERSINKIKKFHYFDRPIPLSALGSLNQVWFVCAMLTSFLNPMS